MYKVVLCDDNEIILDHYEKLLHNLSEKYGFPLSIRKYPSGEALLFDLLEAPTDVDLIYMDVLMNRITGIETVKKLREKGCKAQIVYLTSAEEYIWQALESELFHYLIKGSTSDDRFEQVFLRVMKQIGAKAEDCIIVKSGSASLRLSIDDIIYFSVFDKAVTVYCTGGVHHEFYSKLGELDEKLRDRKFIRIHRSYLINSLHVKRFGRTEVQMDNGDVLTMGRKYYTDAKKEFAKYLVNQWD